jgi:hypothetical protein
VMPFTFLLNTPIEHQISLSIQTPSSLTGIINQAKKTMNSKESVDLTIAREPLGPAKQITRKLDYQKWQAYVSSNAAYFIWAEDTPEGKSTLANLDKVPASFRERVLSAYNKARCFAELNASKNQYNVSMTFHDDLNRITVAFNRPVTRTDIQRFSDLAAHLEAFLFANGLDQITANP